jgi:hypothetical protein
MRWVWRAAARPGLFPALCSHARRGGARFEARRLLPPRNRPNTRALAPPPTTHPPAPAEVGDASNARALFERALTEEPNRRSAPLWERYLALEWDLGDATTALRLEKRAREALGVDGGGGGGGGGGGAAKGLQLQMLLLRYECLDLLPVPPAQRQYVQYLIGKGPPPPGFDRAAGRAGAAAAAGGAAPGAAGAGAGTPAPQQQQHAGPGPGPGAGPGPGGAGPGGRPGAGGTPVGGLISGVLPWAVEEFLNRLPPPQLLDGPMPDVSVLVDAFINTDFDSPAVRQALLTDAAAAAAGGPRGLKRELEDDDDGGRGGGPGAPGGGPRDMYRMRVKQRARAVAGGE